MITKRTKYALKAVLFLATKSPGKLVQIADIAQSESIPRKFLEQILLDLRRAGILESRMGKRGGYALVRSPEQITFGDVMRLSEGSLAPVKCVSHSAYEPCMDCRDEASCPIRAVMVEARDALAGVLDGTTLADGWERVAGKIRETGISYSI